jgi:hypothetical protein
VMRLALDASSSPVATRIVLTAQPALLLLSPDGSRLATLSDGLLSIYELTDGRTLIAAKVAQGETVNGFFLDRDRVRVYVERPPARTMILEISELDVRTRTLRELGMQPLHDGGAHLAVDGAGDRIVAISWEGRRVALLDGRTGAELATLAEAAPDATHRPRFLAGGGIALSESSPRGALVKIFDASGKLLRTVDLGSRRVALGGELSPGQLVVSLGNEERKKWSARVVDVDRGTVRGLGEDLLPVALPGFSINATPQPGSPATRLFFRKNRELVQLDPTTGQTRVLLQTKGSE